MEKRAANERVELPMAGSEPAVLPLHIGFLKTAYLHRPTVDNILFHFKFIKYERNSLANIKRFIIITRCQTKWTEQDSNPQLLCFHKVLSIKLPARNLPPQDKARGESYAIPKGKKSFKNRPASRQNGKNKPL